MMRRAATTAAGVARRVSSPTMSAFVDAVPSSNSSSAWAQRWARVAAQHGKARAWSATPSSGFAASAASRSSTTAASVSSPPSPETLRKIFVFNAVPFVAFGFIDNTVLIYAGDCDYICNWLGNKAWTKTLEWEHKGDFNAASDKEWQLEGKTVARHRNADHFHFMQVYEAEIGRAHV